MSTSAQPPVPTTLKLGRLARTFDKNIPMLHTLMTKHNLALPPVVPTVNYLTGMPPNLGMMLNNTLGDCTCAAFYHALQVWTWNTSTTNPRTMDTEPDKDVELLYEKACGYKPAQGGEGPGGNEQHVLSYILNTGAPCGPTGTQHQKIAAFVEIDVKNTDNIKRGIFGAGLVYIGFTVPAFLMPPGKPPLQVWDVDPTGDNKSIGGHAVILAGYDDKVAHLVSWGGYYTMTWAFFEKFVDEAYAIVDTNWFNKTGKSPGGLSLQQLETAMDALKSA